LQDTPTAAIAAQPTTAGYLTMARHALPSVPPPIDTVDSDRYSNFNSSVADPGSGMGRKSASGSGIRNEQPGSYFLELRNNFLGVKILKFFYADRGSRMETVRIRDPGSGMEESRIRDLG
jgi:hypothetical protein